MQDALYQARILDHYRHPRRKGALEGANVVQRGANPACGDTLTMFIRTDGSRIIDIGFEGDGCAISQAGTSLLLERVVGMSHAAVCALTERDMYDLLGVTISTGRQQCALLALKTLQAACSCK